jgi:hypothetical protein
MTVTELRTLLYNTMKIISFMMDHAMITRSLQKMKAIRELTLLLDSIERCSLHVHYRWLLKNRNQVIDILPPEGRYTKQRNKILSLLHEAERTINADYRQRVRIC